MYVEYGISFLWGLHIVMISCSYYFEDFKFSL
jgi:hypothetical protein